MPLLTHSVMWLEHCTVHARCLVGAKRTWCNNHELLFHISSRVALTVISLEAYSEKKSEEMNLQLKINNSNYFLSTIKQEKSKIAFPGTLLRLFVNCPRFKGQRLINQVGQRIFLISINWLHQQGRQYCFDPGPYISYTILLATWSCGLQA